MEIEDRIHEFISKWRRTHTSHDQWIDRVTINGVSAKLTVTDLMELVDQNKALRAQVQQMQDRVDERARARNDDPSTSHQAVGTVQTITRTMQRILAILGEMHEAGIEAHEILNRYEMKHGRAAPSGIRTRLSTLVDMAKVVVVDRGGFSPSGRSCQRYGIPPGQGSLL